MGNPYGQFILDYFQLLETDAANEEKLEALVSCEDSPVKVGIDTATGEITVVTDPGFLKPSMGSKYESLTRLFIEALEETTRNRLNKQIRLVD